MALTIEQLQRMAMAARGSNLQGQADAQILSGGRAPIYGWLYDALGRSYRTLYRVIPTRVNGAGPVLTSNVPGSFRETPRYPRAFQARSLERTSERTKITRMAEKLDPMRLIPPHVDPTVGAPVTWLSHGEGDTSDGYSYVLGGNGRAIAILMAPKEQYDRYERLGRALWPEIWPQGSAPEGYRHMLVRQVFPVGCRRAEMTEDQRESGCRLTLRNAIELAGATQASMAAKETPLGESISLVRSLGLEPEIIAKQLPPFRWGGSIARDNVDEFLTHPDAQAFARWLRGALGPDAYGTRMADPTNAADTVNSILIGFLPREVLLEGFGSEREERALMAALPIMVQLEQRIRAEAMAEGWGLLSQLPEARRFVNHVRGMSFARTMNEIDDMARQQGLGLRMSGGERVQTLADELTPVAILLGLVLKRGEAARDPSIPVEDTMLRYLEAANRGARDPRQLVAFGFGRRVDDKAEAATALGRALAESMRGPGAEPIQVQTRQGRARPLFGG